MLHTDGTSGGFSDVPFVDSVECSAFYKLIASSKLHRVSERLMECSRNIGYFMDDRCSAGQRLRNCEHYLSDLRNKTKVQSPCIIPPFRSATSGSVPRSSLFSVKHVTSRNANYNDDISISVKHFDVDSINSLWTGMIQYIVDPQCTKCKFVICNADLQFGEGNAAGQFLVSVFLCGVVSILSYFSGETMRDERVKKLSVVFTVLHSSFGYSAGDSLCLFISNRHKFPVCVDSLPRELDLQGDFDKLLAPSSLVEVTSACSWVDEVKDAAFNFHEQICDELDARTSPIILVIVPLNDVLRETLRQAIMDCYSSTPLEVITEDLIKEEPNWDGSSPVIFLCSTCWISSQVHSMRGCALSRMNVRAVIHGGFCEFGESVQEEVVHSISLVNYLAPDIERNLIVMQHNMESFCLPHEFRNEQGNWIHGANALLLLSRRFVMRYSPATLQPQFSLPRASFLSHDGWMHYQMVCKKMQVAGLLVESSEDSEIMEFTSLGRYCSYQFRFWDDAGVGYLTPTDLKLVLWSHLLRQSEDVAEHLVVKNHLDQNNVRGAFRRALYIYGVQFDNSNTQGGDQSSLIQHLAHFGENSQNINRTFHILSSSSGCRTPLQDHYLVPPPTLCRGWFDQAPTNAAMSHKIVKAKGFCLPPASHYCEIQSLDSCPEFRIQCPLGLSYPLIAAHSILHFSAHNNCVFLESGSSNHPVPLPHNLLDSLTMRSLLSGTTTSSGHWLDECLRSAMLAPSEASLLALMPYRRRTYLSFCGRCSLSRKRQRHHAENQSSEKRAFEGVHPRSDAEKDAIMQLVEFAKKAGRDRAEQAFRGVKGFGFLHPDSALFPYYVFLINS